MINKGASVCPCKDKPSPVTVLNRHLTQAVKREAAQQEVCTIMDNLVLILDRGASIKDLVALGSSMTTPVHVATNYATLTGKLASVYLSNVAGSMVRHLHCSKLLFIRKLLLESLSDQDEKQSN